MIGKLFLLRRDLSRSADDLAGTIKDLHVGRWLWLRHRNVDYGRLNVHIRSLQLNLWSVDSDRRLDSHLRRVGRLYVDWDLNLGSVDSHRRIDPHLRRGHR